MVSSSQVSDWFNQDGDLSVPSRIGLPPLIVEYLVVGGGGGGGTGATSANNGGGGGAGGYRSGTLNLSTGTSYTATVGAGGGSHANGSDSVFSSITSTGGGRGGGLSPAVAGSNGGSGGGGGPAGAGAGGSGNTPSTNPSQGNNGASGNPNSPYQGGGGGGAGEAGNTDGLGHGGDGVANSISGSSVVYAGGGGGGADSSPGVGGTGGGGTGSTVNAILPTAGTANTGGGGGGGASQGIYIPGAAGGSGIVILKYPDFYTASTSGVMSTTPSSSDGFKVTTVTSGSGRVTWETNAEAAAAQAARIPPITTGLLAVYDGDSWNGTSWQDIYGTYHATTTRGTITSAITTGNGASKSFTAISGNTGAGLRFPDGILPSTYTLFHVTRTTGGTRSRIVTGSNNNWLSGHWGGGSGIAYHEGWLTGQPDLHGNNWFYSTDQNSLYRSNGVTRGSSGGSASTNLSVNYGSYAEYSDWSLSFLAVYTGTMSATDYGTVEAWIANRFGI
jgi:hypothetical protein